MTNVGLLAIQRFGFDLVPLVLLVAIAVTGLALTASSLFWGGRFYWFISLTHEVVVVLWLLSIPFGKFFHIIERPASIGVTLYHQWPRRGAFRPGIGLGDQPLRALRRRAAVAAIRGRSRGRARRPWADLRPGRRSRGAPGVLPHLQAGASRQAYYALMKRTFCESGMSVNKDIFAPGRAFNYDFQTTGAPEGWPSADRVPEALVPTHCSFCGVQCAMYLRVSGGKVIGVEPRDYAHNRGKLCPKGVVAYQQADHPDRLRYPMIRRKGGSSSARVGTRRSDYIVESLAGASRPSTGATPSPSTAGRR